MLIFLAKYSTSPDRLMCTRQVPNTRKWTSKGLSRKGSPEKSMLRAESQATWRKAKLARFHPRRYSLRTGLNHNNAKWSTPRLRKSKRRKLCRLSCKSWPDNSLLQGALPRNPRSEKRWTSCPFYPCPCPPASSICYRDHTPWPWRKSPIWIPWAIEAKWTR